MPSCFSAIETKAKLSGPSEYIHSGSTLKLSCRVYLGPRGPDADYARNAVIHWFHEQRLLDPELERWRSRSSQPRIMTNTEIGPTGIEGWLEIAKVTPFDSGNYTCVPSYAIPAWIQILVLPGKSKSLISLWHKLIIAPYCRCISGWFWRCIRGQSGYFCGSRCIPSFSEPFELACDHHVTASFVPYDAIIKSQLFYSKNTLLFIGFFIVYRSTSITWKTA